MNGKKAKELRSAKQEMKVIIDVKTGQVEVFGFPRNYHQALSWMDAARNTVMSYFLTAAKLGRLDDNGNVTEGQKTPKTALLGPGNESANKLPC